MMIVVYNVCSWVSITPAHRNNIFLVLMCMFCRSLFVLLSFFFWPMCCLSCFDLRILTTLFVSSNSSFEMLEFFFWYLYFLYQ